MEKLIRHKIPEIAEKAWNPLAWRIIQSTKEQIIFLLQKLEEEKKEYNEAKWESTFEEIADVLEVYDTLIFVYGKLGEIEQSSKIVFEKQKFISEAIPGNNEEMQRKIYTIREKKGEEKWRFYEGIIGIFPNP